MSSAPLLGFLLVVAGLAAGHAAMRLGGEAPGEPRPVSEYLFACTGFALVVISWVGVILSEVGYFGLVPLTGTVSGIACALVAVALSRGRVGAPPLRPGLLFGVSVLLLLLMSMLYAEPFDTRLEARDPGVYELAGWSLARHGSWAYTDPVVAGLEAETRERLFPAPRLPAAYDSLRYLGFYLEDRDSGRVVPQFLPLYSVWAAIANLVAGAAGVGYASVLAAMLSALAVLFLGYRLGGREVGILASLWLALNVSQAWFARYSGAELLAQLLLGLAGWSFLEYRRTGHPVLGMMAAWAAGLIWFTKAELFVLALPLALLLLVERACGKASRRIPTFWVPLALIALHAALHARFVSWPYVHYLTLVVEIPAWAVALLLAGGLGVFVATWRWLGRWPPARRQRCADLVSGRGGSGRAWRWLAAGVIVVVTAYNYWIRPAQVGWNAGVLVDLGTTITPLALILAVSGIVLLLLARNLPRGASAWIGILLFGVATVVWNRSIFPEFLWVTRRYLPIMIPLAALAGAFALWRVRILVTRFGCRLLPEPVATVLGWGLLIAVGGLVASDTAATTMRYRDVPELSGSGGILAQLDAALEPGALVVVEPRSTRGLLRFEAALDYVLEREVLRLATPEVDGTWLRDLVWDQTRRERPVYLLTTGYLGLIQEPRLVPVANLDVAISKLEETVGRLPERVETLRFRFRLYRFLSHGSLDPLDGGLDVGEWDDLYIDALSLWETERDAQGRSYRWTAERARFFLPGLGSGAGSLSIWADPDTPPSLPEQTMEVSLDGRTLGTFTLHEGWRAYQVDLPEDWSPPADGIPVLELAVPGFRPADHDPASDDRRVIGTKVDRITWAERTSGGSSGDAGVSDR